MSPSASGSLCAPVQHRDHLLLQEAKAKEAITQLKAEIANLTRLAEAGSALSMGEEATLNELMKQRDELARERDAQVRAPCRQLNWQVLGDMECVASGQGNTSCVDHKQEQPAVLHWPVEARTMLRQSL